MAEGRVSSGSGTSDFQGSGDPFVLQDCRYLMYSSAEAFWSTIQMNM